MTGSAGAVAVDADGQPATSDALLSQSALAATGNHIFAVNAGSNTLSMLAISRSDPAQLTVVGDPIKVLRSVALTDQWLFRSIGGWDVDVFLSIP
ncbi:hypothetical protein B0J15DRAFT_569651 [Fusarium solani]|uniref:Uncharacterized protein n=1 Tax=Fusarium solani TaxID=169388 RepID=A0A9P9JUX7_FUSSL|nr:uncharacterized protein B0J15DRAFT_569651 [Fusarium solani]KAH7237928.1 hypothetical protein B0J15DRAFT_569651 [Fusarium solani]